MTVDELEEFYGTQAKAAAAIGCTPQAVSNWRNKGRIPTDYQLRWEVDSKGVLRADIPMSVRAA